MATSDARTLATQLSGLDDERLAALLQVRGVAPDAALDDLYDLAETLLDAASIAHGLERLPRADAASLGDAVTDAASQTPARRRLQDLALVAPDGRAYPAVAAAYRPPAPVAAHSSAGEPEPASHAAERAFSAAASLADVLESALTAPLGRIGSGSLGAVDRRRLVDLGAIDRPETADVLVEIAERTGLLAARDRRICVTPDGRDWRASGTAERWCTVAVGLRDALPAGLRTAEGGWSAVADWPAAYPLDPAWPAASARWRALFAYWAVIGPDGEPTPWASGLSRGDDADAEGLRTLLPPEVDRVFLQNDLTAIAPGPLVPAVDLRLRRIARRESRAQAATFRFTSETISNALTGGETADSLREFLQQISLTGIPQPLAYEIDRAAGRHGGVRVSATGDGRTRVSGLRDLVAAVEVDQSLRPLGLVRDGDGLITRSTPETALWMLADARYPVIAQSSEGSSRTITREVVVRPEAPRTPSEVYGPLLARLREGHGTGSDAAWLGRELEQAVRDRAVVTIDVHMPDGSTRSLTMELTGIGGGRLRGLDRGADVERTLPISSVRGVRPA